MASVFRPTTVEDEPQLIEFLKRAFAGHDTAFLDPPVLRWKYWEPRGDFSGPRSYIVEKDGRIAAHAGVWPVTLRTGAGTECGLHMMDWGSDPQAPGAGVSLLQRLTKLHDFVYAIGGSEMTLSILPKFGFRAAGETLVWARPLRPWGQMLRHQSRDGRLPLRFARNLWWSQAPRRTAVRDWSAVLLQAGEDAPTVPSGERDRHFFRHLRQFPAGRFVVFRLDKGGRAAGVLALSTAEQAGVAGVWLEDPSAANWCAAFRLAQDAALRHAGSLELIARCANEAGSAGAAQAGMRLRARLPVFVFRKNGACGPLPLDFQLGDNDALFRAERQVRFLT